MGLDNEAARHPDGGLTEEDEQAFRDAGIELCNSIYNSGASFRGKIYEALILHVTGFSLYFTWLSPKDVREMAEALNRYSAKQLTEIWNHLDGILENEDGHSERQVANLQRFFAICAERGLGLMGSW